MSGTVHCVSTIADGVKMMRDIAQVYVNVHSDDRHPTHHLLPDLTETVSSRLQQMVEYQMNLLVKGQFMSLERLPAACFAGSACMCLPSSQRPPLCTQLLQQLLLLQPTMVQNPWAQSSGSVT